MVTVHQRRKEREREREREHTHNSMPQYSKQSIFHESKSKLLEYNEAYLYDSLTLNLLGLRPLNLTSTSSSKTQ
jgi:hypothetical protein